MKTANRGQMSESFLTAVFLSLSGGLQDAYTYLFRGKVFANAQTGNIVLLSAPWATLLERVTSRSNNPYGRTQAQQDEIRFYQTTVEPLLRRSATLELDGASPVNELADAVEALTA